MYDNKDDNFYLVGLNLRYQFTPNFSAEVGYNYDNLNSSMPGGIMTETGFTSESPAAISLTLTVMTGGWAVMTGPLFF